MKGKVRDILKRLRLWLLGVIPVRKICPYPFARMELGKEKFIPCCGHWLTDTYHSLPTGEKFWNGVQAKELRRSILQGNFKYCKRDLCNVALSPLFELLVFPRLHREAPLARRNWLALLQGKTVMPEMPKSTVLTADPRCNLACPSCRPTKILDLTPAASLAIKTAETDLSRLSPTLEVIRIAGDGEVFYSPWLRQRLQECSSENYPHLREVFLTTNGLLMNEHTFKELEPGSKSVTRISVSVDAGDELTYSKVRGGNWKTLQKNLEWVGRERKRGRFKWFQINAVIRKASFESLPKLIELGESIGVDSVKLTYFYDVKRANFVNYAEEAIHLPAHPRHSEWSTFYKRYVHHPLVNFLIPVPSER